MQTVSLSTSVRSLTGKGAARRMRRSGEVPGILYGPKRTPLPVMFSAKEFRTTIARYESAPLLKLVSGDADLEGRVVLLKDTQYNALSGDVTHADFYEVDMSQPIRVPVALHFVGKAAGLVSGGILQPIRRELEVECLPSDIPEFIEIDVSRLDIHDSIHVSEVTLQDGLVPVFDTDFTLVTVAAPTTSGASGSGEGGTAEASAESEAS